MFDNISTLKILIISSNVKFRSELKRDLYVSHNNVIVAHDANEGFRLAFTVSPSVILLDWSKSSNEFFMFSRKMKKNQKTSSIPVFSLEDVNHFSTKNGTKHC